MKQLLIIIAAVVLLGCGESQLSTPAPEVKPETPTTKEADISIHDATAKGNIEAVKQHLVAGIDVNGKGYTGLTSLHEAAASGHTEVVELLIANGAKVNGEGGTTPLHCATGVNHKEIVKLIITKGADVNAKDIGGRSFAYSDYVRP